MDRGSLNRAFGAELRDRREDADIDQEDVWQAMDMKRNTYKRTERGDRDVLLADLFAAADALNVSPTTFFNAVRKRLQTGNFPNPTADDEWRQRFNL